MTLGARRLDSTLSGLTGVETTSSGSGAKAGSDGIDDGGGNTIGVVTEADRATGAAGEIDFLDAAPDLRFFAGDPLVRAAASGSGASITMAGESTSSSCGVTASIAGCDGSATGDGDRDSSERAVEEEEDALRAAEAAVALPRCRPRDSAGNSSFATGFEPRRVEEEEDDEEDTGAAVATGGASTMPRVEERARRSEPRGAEAFGDTKYGANLASSRNTDGLRGGEDKGTAATAVLDSGCSSDVVASSSSAGGGGDDGGTEAAAPVASACGASNMRSELRRRLESLAAAPSRGGDTR